MTWPAGRLIGGLSPGGIADFFLRGLTPGVAVPENPADDGDKWLWESNDDAIKMDLVDFWLVQSGVGGATIMSTAIATPPVDYVWLDELPIPDRKIKRRKDGQ